jgi:penicillin G amidase
LTPDSDDSAKALAMLEPFDLDAGSATAALFEVWFTRHLRPAITRALLGDAAVELVGPADSRVAVEAVTDPDRWWSHPDRDALLRETLAEAWRETSELLGNDPGQWRWGDLHRIALEHPLAAHAPAGLRAQMELPALPLGGSHFTPHAAAYRSASSPARRSAWSSTSATGMPR